jgi:8-oxo-dGTP diphosphatase
MVLAGAEGGCARLPRLERGDILGGMTNDQIRPQVGVGVVFLQGDRVFLAKRHGSHGEDTWASAGGHLEMGETLEECARREAMEELGVTVGDLRFLCVTNIIAYDKHYLDIEFLGDIGEQEPVLAEPEAFTESGWFPLDDLPQPLFEAVRYALDSLGTGQYYYPGG